MTAAFVRYELRTTDVTSARAFYADVLGSSFWTQDVSVAQLPATAIARGAPPHWLGHIGTGDVEGTATRVATLGGQRLGPAQPQADGSLDAVLRDPFGAVVAVSSGPRGQRPASVAWHLHNSQDQEAAFGFYSGLFAWGRREAVESGPPLVHHRLFAWDEAGPTAGSMADMARLPHVHPQWLFFFPVPDIETAIGRVGALHGLALEPTRTPSGDIVAPCDDPQGAAFGLWQAGRETSPR